MKIVINRCYGGFQLSENAIHWLREQGCQEAINLIIVTDPKWTEYFLKDHKDSSTIEFFLSEDYRRVSKNCNDLFDNDRTNEWLIKLVEVIGDDANGECAKLEVVEIPDGIDWEIEEYDGYESIHEKHRSW